MATAEGSVDRDDRAKVLVIGGVTASGKSGLALAIAERRAATIINADALQVYDALPILTAQPGPAERTSVPHRLYGVLDAREPCSAARWRRRAIEEIDAALAAGRLPIVVGGTGLYLKALIEGIALIPPIPAELRAATQAERERLGAAEFHAALARLDPVMAARLAPHDTARTLRAYEVVAATGRSLATWWRETGESAPFNFVSVLLLPPREATVAASDRRFERMVAAGALAEVAALAARALDPGLPVFKALGHGDLRRHISGDQSLADAISGGQQASRRYAKRQRTWFRHHMMDAKRVGAQFSESIFPEIFAFIRRHC